MGHAGSLEAARRGGEKKEARRAESGGGVLGAQGEEDQRGRTITLVYLFPSSPLQRRKPRKTASNRFFITDGFQPPPKRKEKKRDPGTNKHGLASAGQMVSAAPEKEKEKASSRESVGSDRRCHSLVYCSGRSSKHNQ